MWGRGAKTKARGQEFPSGQTRRPAVRREGKCILEAVEGGRTLNGDKGTGLCVTRGQGVGGGRRGQMEDDTEAPAGTGTGTREQAPDGGRTEETESTPLSTGEPRRGNHAGSMPPWIPPEE